jgi:hypothetical protein
VFDTIGIDHHLTQFAIESTVPRVGPRAQVRARGHHVVQHGQGVRPGVVGGEVPGIARPQVLPGLAIEVGGLGQNLNHRARREIIGPHSGLVNNQNTITVARTTEPGRAIVRAFCSDSRVVDTQPAPH